MFHAPIRPAAPLYVGYSERAYFTTDACAHCAERDEHDRRVRLDKASRDAFRSNDRRR